MFSTEQRTKAIETFIKYDHSHADTIAELGYPTRSTLRIWRKEYEATGEVTAGVYEREPRYSDEQRRVAVDHYLAHGKRLSRTMRTLGYPGSRETLACWVDEPAPASASTAGPTPRPSRRPLPRRSGWWPSWRRGRGRRRRWPSATEPPEPRPTFGEGS